MKLAIVTGCSGDLGRALVRLLLENSYNVIGIARTASSVHFAPSELVLSSYHSLDLDISKPEKLEEPLTNAVAKININSFTEILLIQSAATVEPIGLVGTIPPHAIRESIQTNLLGPSVIANWFIRIFADSPANKLMVFISSGAAVSPIRGATFYTVTKSAIETLAQAIGCEQEGHPFPIRSIAVRPGVFESNMQNTMRSLDKRRLPDVDQFLDMKAKGILRSSAEIARVIFYEFIVKPRSSGKIYDVWKFLDKCP